MYSTLKDKKDFEKLAKQGQSFFTQEFGFKILKNNLKQNRYGIVVNLKVDKRAVVRNKIRRRLRDIIQENEKNLKKGFNLMILTREGIKSLDFANIRLKLVHLFKKAKIL
ncbi:MAG: ribonuclease P protein component [Patescibacteria group bacterium]